MDKGIIRHCPLLDVNLVAKHYSQRYGVPIKYVCTTALDGSEFSGDVFYRETPHPEFGNRYFILYTSPSTGDIMISNADRIEGLTFDCVTDSEAHLWYSRHRHDCVQTDNGNIIDGGRAYTRTSAAQVFTCVVKDGIMVQT